MSIEAIRAKLLPKFITTSKGRVEKARAAIAAGKPKEIREEMHSITGDAGMIGQPEIADLARACSAQARAWEDGDAAAQDSCRAALDVLSAKIAGLVAPG